MNAGCAGKTEIPWERMPYPSALEACSRQGAIQSTFTFTFTFNKMNTIRQCCGVSAVLALSTNVRPYLLLILNQVLKLTGCSAETGIQPVLMQRTNTNIQIFSLYSTSTLLWNAYYHNHEISGNYSMNITGGQCCVAWLLLQTWQTKSTKSLRKSHDKPSKPHSNSTVHVWHIQHFIRTYTKRNLNIHTT